MKGMGKGWWIAAGVILVLAVICLCGGDVQAFLGGVVVAGIVLAVGSRKSKHRTAADVPPVASRGGGHEMPRSTPRFLLHTILTAPAVRPLGPGTFRSTGRMVRTCEWTGRCSRIL